MRDFKKLTIWQRSHRLAIQTHHLLAGVRERGSAATRNQLQRAMASIPSNISEGAGKRTDREFARYLDIALGSAKEAENHLAFSRDMGWLDSEQYEKLDAELGEIRRMLFAFARTVRDRSTHASSGD
ncbi:MAG: four helix bundle protein [bacterium]